MPRQKTPKPTEISSKKKPTKHIKVKETIVDPELEKIEYLEDQLEDVQEDLQEERQFEKLLKWILTILAIVFISVGIGFGFYAYNSQRKISNTNTQLSEQKKSAENKEKELQEQNLKLATASEENDKLKKDASAKAAQEAEAALKQKQEEEKNSKRFANADKKETNLPGLNVRKSPCGELAGGLRVWGASGEILEGPTKPGPCLNGDYEWYKLKWSDGLEGWSIANYLTFGSERQVSKVGYVTGFAQGGYDYTNNKMTTPTICATNLADNITNCNVEIDPNSSTYKILLTAGEYNFTGKYKYQDWESKKYLDETTMYSAYQQCGYKPECKSGWNKPAKVVVPVGGVVTDIYLSVPYNPDLAGNPF
jgi:cell division protein FtsL